MMKIYKLKKANFSHYFIPKRKFYFVLLLLLITLFIFIIVYWLLSKNLKKTTDNELYVDTAYTQTSQPTTNKVPNRKLEFKNYTYSDFSIVFNNIFNILNNTRHYDLLQASILKEKHNDNRCYPKINNFIVETEHLRNALKHENSITQPYPTEYSMYLLFNLIFLFHDFLIEIHSCEYSIDIDSISKDGSIIIIETSNSLFIGIIVVNQFLHKITEIYNGVIKKFQSEFKDIETDINLNISYKRFVRGFYQSLNNQSKDLLIKTKIDIGIFKEGLDDQPKNTSDIILEETNNRDTFTELYLIKSVDTLKRFIMLSFYPIYYYLFEFSDKIRLRENIKEFITYLIDNKLNPSVKCVASINSCENDNTEDILLGKIVNRCEKIFKVIDFEGHVVQNNLESYSQACFIELRNLNNYIDMEE